jgi:tetratricopeptide (TPR) repeat protein
MRLRILTASLIAGSLALPSPSLAIPAQDARTQSFKLQSEGMRLYREGKYKDAVAVLQQVVNINLNSFMAFYYLGICLNADRRYGEAIEPLKIALDLQPDYVQAHLALGDACLKQGDTGEARAEYLRALELQPGYAPAHDGLGRLFETMGQDDEAEAQYRKALEINVAFADAYTHLGDLFLRKDRPEDAIQLFLKAIAMKPDFSSAFTRLGVAYAREKLYDDAIAAIRKSQTLTPLDPEPYVSLARIYLELQSFVRAEAEIQAALAQDPDHAGAHLVLSDLKRAQEDFAAAVEVLEGLHERGIEDALMRRAVAEALKRVRQDAALHAGLVAAAGRVPAAPSDLVALARFLSTQGAHRRAGELFLDAAPLLSTPAPAGPAAPGSAPISAAQATFEAGAEFLTARLYPRAAELFSSLAQPAAGDAGGESPDRVPAELRAAALFNLGVARAALRLDEQAIEAFTTYVSGAPADARGFLYLGNACLRLGRKDAARAAYQSFLERARPGPEIAQVRRILESLDRPPAASAGKVP